MNLEKQNSNNMEKLKKYKREYKLALMLGIIVFVDILLGGAGIYIISGTLYVILSAFFTKSTVLGIIGFYKISYLILFIFAIILNRKIKIIEKTEGMEVSEKGVSKGFKKTLTLILVPFGILMVVSILLNLFT